MSLIVAFVLGFLAHAFYDLVLPRIRRRFTYWRLERAALPEGTRVRLVCAHGCGFKDHDGIWTASWTPRRQKDPDAPDDYLLVREIDGETTFAKRNALEVVK